jgi:hypothetical protein
VIPSDINQEALDLMTDFGGESLAGAAKIFMIEANKHGFSAPDACILFATLLVAKAAGIIRALAPGESSLQLIQDMVEDAWHETELN